MFYEHVETRISSLSYIKLKRLDNDIKTKSISRTCTNDETKGKQEKKNATAVYRTRNGMHNKNSMCMERNGPLPKHSATEPSISPSVITCTVQVNRKSWLRRNNNGNFCKITKICLLETK